MHKLCPRFVACEFGSAIKAAVERPLVNHVKRSRIGCHMRDRIFRDDIGAHRSNERADAVIHEGVHVIGVRGNHHKRSLGDFMLTPALLTHLAHLSLIDLLCALGAFNSFANFRSGDLRECFFNGTLDGLAFIEINKGRKQFRFRVRAFKIKFQCFRIAAHHWAGKTARDIGEVCSFFRHTRQPNGFHTFFGKPRHVPVGEFRGQT